MHSTMRAPAEAEKSFLQALDLQQALVAQYPEDLELQSSFGGVYNNLGIVLEELGRIEDAASAYKAAVEHQRIAFSQAKDVSRYRSFLSKHYYNYGRVLRQLGYPEQAVRSALARRELWANDPHRLFSIAEELAIAGAAMKAAGDSATSANQCANLAVETLQQAVAAGMKLPADLSNSESFAFLKDNIGFMNLVKKLMSSSHWG